MKNKNGFLLASEVVKIVIAIICIVFLVWLLASLYYSKVNAERKIQAQNTLEGNNKVLDEIKKVGGGGTPNPDGVQLLVPKGWYLFTFTGEGVRPNSCTGVNCVCICDNVWYGYWIKTEEQRQAERCDNTGACVLTPQLKNYEKELEIKIGTKTIMVNPTAKGVEITEK